MPIPPLDGQRRRSIFSKQVLGLIGFTAAGGMLFTGLFYMADHFKTGGQPVARAVGRIETGPVRSGGVLFLPPDITHRSGKTWLTYRGKIDAEHFVIDVTIPELDPQTAYPHQLSITDARKGFSLVGRVYRLVGIRSSGIRLKHG